MAEYGQRNQLAKYGLTTELYQRLLADQEGKCAICREARPGYVGERAQKERERRLYVDHEDLPDDMKFIRGILCNKCNFGISHFNHDPELLLAAARYMEHALQNRAKGINIFRRIRRRRAASPKEATCPS